MAKSAVTIRRSGGAVLKKNGAGGLVAPATGNCCGCADCPSDICTLCADNAFPMSWALTIDSVAYGACDAVCIPLPGGRVFSDGQTYRSIKMRYSSLGYGFTDPNGTYSVGDFHVPNVTCTTITTTTGPNLIGVLLDSTIDCSLGLTKFVSTSTVQARLERVSGFWVSSINILLSPYPGAGTSSRFYNVFYDRIAVADGASCKVPLAFTNQLTGTCSLRTIDGLEFADLGSGGTMTWTPCVPFAP